jgi:putative ABC transport system ATP-binding protein
MNTAMNTTKLIRLNNVSKKYQMGATRFTALDNVSLNIGKGEFAAVMGPSGSGKSTLLNMITGIDRPSEGQVFIADHAVHEMSENRLATWRGGHMGIIFQFFQLLPALSLLHNVMLPMDFARKYPSKQRAQQAMQLLEHVGLADHARKLPGMVSGGQQQRAAIARALANDPPLIVADEPTGNLDSKTTEKIFELFHLLVAQGKTMLMVTHDHDLVRQVPRVIEIKDGQITQDSCMHEPAEI